MEGDLRETKGSGAVFHPVDLGRQRGLSHRHIFRELVEAGSLLFILDELTCSLRRRARNRPDSSEQ